MTRNPFYTCFYYASVRLIVFIEKMFNFLVTPRIDLSLPLSLVTFASPSPEAVRSFWSRITARCDEPVPRTA